MTGDRRMHRVVKGFAFVESLRWHENALWFVDMHGGTIHCMAATLEAGGEQSLTSLVGALDSPSGLVWSREGEPVVVSMVNRKLVAIPTDGRPAVRADLSRHSCWPLNDAIAGLDGTVYVGTFGFDMFGGAAYAEGLLLAVDTNGVSRVAADRMAFPNGMAIMPVSATLLVAESAAGQITAFTIAGDGKLHDRRIWAQLTARCRPDGICLDEEGMVWAALPEQRACVRIEAGGRVVEQLDFGDRLPISCVLGGEDGRSLYVSSAATLRRELAVAQRDSRIDRIAVSVPAPATASES
jgi:sugar lactone lactonase YvrE